MELKEIESTIIQLKKSIEKELLNDNYENALLLIKTTANLLYKTNYCYVDESLEEAILTISQKLKLSADKGVFSNEKVLFFDGFGLNNRGLVQIYLKALCRIKKVIYVTYDNAAENIPDVLDIVKTNGGEAAFINTASTNTAKVVALVKLINDYKAGHFFFYSTPDDIVATTAMHAFTGKVKRYQINLTDHAFWLGARALDICVDFRDYGASVSRDYRGIDENKIKCLPYYPSGNFDISFEGFPFTVDEKQKIVFFRGCFI